MSMLRAFFFEAGADTTLFDGLYIAGNKEICEQYMGKYPVIFLSLKSVEGLSYEDARYRITELAGREAQRFFHFCQRVTNYLIMKRSSIRQLSHCIMVNILWMRIY